MVNYNVVLLSDVVSLMAGLTTSLPMSFEHEYQTAMPTPYYTTTAYASAPITPSRLQGITPQLMIPRATAPTP
ncbi:hypothetical protein DAPPUDRAFT_309695 [Daphnia pulex]|uniref:Uncharacterized protein n=1 Tax=Daphnia pulex TaxID=6669 RepID=E9FS95_DAPPU|nr:hypothetical protein DAPPUDRAFT_309695 [Daphnia pulex]|eukprot:EFX90361.1 hypothetical protein DAPPUDRAFT_309695 [Daphnia pulex]